MLETGLIIDMGKYTVTVLTRDNGYYKLLRKPTMYISQELQFKKADIVNMAYFAKRSSLVAAAAILIIFMMAFYFNMNNNRSTFVAEGLVYVSLDINPGVQFSVSDDDKVMDVMLMNNDAKNLFGEWKPQGMGIEDAVYDAVKKCREKGIVKNDVKNYFLLSGTYDNKAEKDSVAALDERIAKILNKLKGNIDSVLPGQNETLIIKCNPDYKKAADKNNVTLGRYTLYCELNKSGYKLSLDDVKNWTVSDLIETYRNIPSGTINTDTPQPFVTPLGTGITNIFTAVPNTEPGKVNTSGNKSTPASAITFIPTPEDKGSGLRGEYYDNIDMTNFKLARIDSKLDFCWNGNNPPPKPIVNDGSYSCRWMGLIKPPQSGKYTFYITRDNGARLWVDGELLIDKWNSDSNITDSGSIDLEGGKKYDIKIEYFNNAGQGTIKLEWSSGGIAKTVVPASCLYPATSLLPAQSYVPGNGTGLSREYYDNPDLTSLVVTGTDPEINFNWGVGSPDAAMKVDQQFSCRWSGYIQPLYSEDYVFHISHDDGIRLWINGRLEVDKWKNSDFYSETRKIPLEAGKKYKIKLEYCNTTIAGRVVLEWSSPSTKRSVVPKSRLFPLK